MSEKTVQNTIDERGENYGSYSIGTETIGNIMQNLCAAHFANTGTQLTEVEKAMFFPIVQKLVRLSTTPDHIDSWHDIAGYAQLARDYIANTEEVFECLK